MRSTPIPHCLASLLLVAPLLSACGTDLPEPEPADGSRIELPAGDLAPHEFLNAWSVAEQPDGTVLVTDWVEGALLHIDFDAGSVRPLGARGEGPGEFRAVGALVQLSPDTVGMMEGSGRRFHRITGGALVGADSVVAGPGSLIGRNTLGAWVIEEPVGSTTAPEWEGARVRADSSVVLRYAGAGAPADTLVRRLAALVSMVSGQPSRMIPTALWPHSLVLTFPDGWVSVAHADPYRTERIGPGGERVIGEVLPVESEAWARTSRPQSSHGPAGPKRGISWASSPATAWRRNVSPPS